MFITLSHYSLEIEPEKYYTNMGCTMRVLYRNVIKSVKSQ